MKSKKILLIIFMAVMLIASSMNFVYADSFSVTMTSDKQNYAPGQIVKITVSLTDINATPGLYALNGNLVYDEDVFEPIISNNSGVVTSKADGVNKDLRAVDPDEWGSVTYNTTEPNFKGDFAINTASPVSSGRADVMIIQLKVKEGAKLGATTIQIAAPRDSDGNAQPGIASSNNDVDLFTTPAAIGVNIKEQSEGEIPPAGETPNPEPTKEPTPTPATSKPIVTPSASTNLPNGGSNNGKLPQTGLTDYAAPVIIGALVISLIAFIAYRRYKDI